MRSVKRLAILTALLLATAAHAQEMPMLPGEGGGGVDPALAAPYPIETNPSDGVVLDGIDGSLDTLSTTSEQQLDEMTRGVGGGAPAAPGSSAAPASKDYVELPTMGVTGDLEDVTRLRQHQKDILLLETLNEKADLAIGLWEKVNNNENAIASRMARQKEASDAAREESERLAREAALSAGATQNTVTAVQMPQAAPVVVEVIGSEASILVPDVGMVIARPGDRLPNGMTVVSMGVSGVVVATSGGPRRTLGFGTSIGGSGVGQP